MNSKTKTRYTQEKGITLIALVITIIVLLILAGVTINMVLRDDGIILQAQDAKAKTEEVLELEKVQLAVASALISGNGEVDLTVNSEEANSIDKALKEEFGNKKPKYEEGKITLSNGDIYSITITGGIKKLITFSKTGNLVIGTEVTASNGETFYVIGEGEVGTEVNEDTQDDILLLAKYNLKKENGNITLKQDTDVDACDTNTWTCSNACAFASAKYWNNGTYPDANDTTTCPLNGATSIVTTAKEYGESIGVIGRLMTKEEASILHDKSVNEKDVKIKNILYGIYEKGKFIRYWLGSVNGYYVSCVFGEGPVVSGRGYDDKYGFGVRPVIEIPETLITKNSL